MDRLVIVRGGGDLATGTIYKLYQCGFKVLVLEIARPLAIRRNVSFSEAMYTGSMQVEDVVIQRVSGADEAIEYLNQNKLVIMEDEHMECLSVLKPIAVIDAILAKKNLGTYQHHAPITIALGPGFCAGKDVDAVIETKRGHQLGRVIYNGYAIKNTGIPGIIAGYGKERVIHAPASGVIRHIRKITDIVCKDEVIAYIEGEQGCSEVKASLDGLLRGLIRDGFVVKEGLKIADIDPRIDEYDNCFTISDKARCIAGGVVEALMYLMKQKGLHYD